MPKTSPKSRGVSFFSRFGTKCATLLNHYNSLLKLTRWKEYITFVFPLTIMGSLLALRTGSGLLDIKIIFVTFGNILAVAYAFMLNDIEDAQDDARDPKKARRNPISNKSLSKTAAYRACFFVALATIVFFALVNWWVLWVGITTLLLSHFYSWKPVRLKAWPVVDIVSHSLMLSGLLILSGYYTYQTTPGIVWYVIAGATMFSVYGQLYNQIRDYEVDKKAKLKNTAILLGKTKTQNFMYLSILIAIYCFGFAAFKGVFPYWLIFILLGSILFSTKVKTKSDFTGTAAVDITGTMQLQAHITMNIVTFSWLLVTLISQWIK